MIIGVMTVNEYEKRAIQEVLRNEGYQVRSSEEKALGCQVEHLVGKYPEIIHVNNKSSGNLTAALSVQQNFLRLTLPVLGAFVFFGCAGMVPKFGRKRRGEILLALGDIVVVKEAVYPENGEVSTDKVTGKEMVKLKAHRFDLFKTQADWNYGVAFARIKPLRQVKAASVEKVITVRMTKDLPPSSSGSKFVDYAGALRDTGAEIVDMESYGFMQGIDPVYRNRIAIFRVITDQVKDHGASKKDLTDKNGETIFTAKQEHYLNERASTFVEFLEFFRESSRGADLSADSRRVGPTRSLNPELVRVALDASIARVGSAQSAKKQAAKEFAANLIPIFFRLFRRESPTIDSATISEAGYLLRGLNNFVSRGYGSKETARFLHFALRTLPELAESPARWRSSEPKNQNLAGSAIFASLIWQINPLTHPLASLKSCVEFYFGKTVSERTLRFEFNPNVREITISRRKDGETHHLSKIVVSVGQDVDRQMRRTLPELREEENTAWLRWDGFDQDTELVSTVSQFMNLSTIQSTQDKG